MPRTCRQTFGRSGLFFALLLLHNGLASGKAEIAKGPYNKWPEAFTLSNGQVEAVIVPAIGRVMQFRFVGESDGPLWENHALDGKPANSQSAEWINFGGDKTWPSPQGEWEKVTGRGWPPPKAFDSMPVEVSPVRESLILRSAIDPSYGIRTERKIRLIPGQAEMEITTTYQKVEGPPVRVGIWIITQLKDPQKVFMPVPPSGIFASGYNKQSEKLPADLAVAGSMVTCRRSPRDSTKIGSDGSDLVWAGEKWVLQIHAPREREGEFPDHSSSTEIYTNPDPNAYVELETLGPLKTMNKGDIFVRSQTYRLFRRNGQTVDDQVRSILEK